VSLTSRPVRKSGIFPSGTASTATTAGGVNGAAGFAGSVGPDEFFFLAMRMHTS
jgi:hypothetical protein